MPLPPVKFSEAVIPATPLDPDKMISWFGAYLSYPQDRRWSVMHDDVAKQQAIVEALTAAFLAGSGLSAVGAPQILSGMARRVPMWRRYVGLMKVPVVLDQATRWLVEHPDEKLVLFTCHRSVTEELMHALRGYGAISLYEGTPQTKRTAMATRFAQRPANRVLVATAGTAIDMSAASAGWFVEPSWQADDNAQSVLRIYNRRQKRPVRIRFLGLDGSVDARIVRTLKIHARTMVRQIDEENTPEVINPFL